MRNDARRIERPTAGASAISRLGWIAREGYIMAEHLGFSLLLMAIAQATILLIFWLHDCAQIAARRNHPSVVAQGNGSTAVSHYTATRSVATSCLTVVVTPLGVEASIQWPGHTTHPSGLEFTGLPDARRSHAHSLAPRRQDDGIIHSRHHIGPTTGATIEWYLQRGELSRFRAYSRPEDN
jgi:hypothetical protein